MSIRIRHVLDVLARRLPITPAAVLPACLLVIAWMCWQGGAQAQADPAKQTQSVPVLEVGKSIERELAGGQSHRYTVQLGTDQYVHILVDQRGIDVLVLLFTPGGQQIVKVDSPNGTKGPETVSLIAEAGGHYELEVRALDKEVPTGVYEIKVVELRLATEKDRILAENNNLKKERVALRSARKYDEALPLAKKILENAEKVFYPGHPEVSAAYVSLAQLHTDVGDFANAEAAHKRNLETSEAHLGSGHQEVGRVLNKFGLFYLNKSKYAEAEPILQRALAVMRNLPYPHPDDLAGAYLNLGILYRDAGNFPRAESPLLKARELWKQASSVYYFTAMINLGEMYWQWGVYDKAEAIFQEAIDSLQKENDQGGAAAFLLDLGGLYADAKQYDKAEHTLRKAKDIFQARGGANSTDVALTLGNLGVVYYAKGDYIKAEETYLQALEIYKKSGRPRILLLLQVGQLYRVKRDYPKAESFYLRALNRLEELVGPNHPDRELIHSIYEIAELYRAQGTQDKAVAAFTRLINIQERYFAVNLAGLPERRKASFLDLFSDTIGSVLSLQARSAPGDEAALRLAITLLLRSKGRISNEMVDMIAALRQHTTQPTKELLDKYVNVRSRLSTLTLQAAGAGASPAYKNNLNRLEEEFEKIEAEVSSNSIEFRTQLKPVTLEAIQGAIPNNNALVEWAHYSPVDPRTGKREASHYLAYVLTSRDQIKWADIGKAEPIDRAINQFRQALQNPRSTNTKRLARIVDEKVMQPIRQWLGSTTKLLISPDGALNLLPFAALVDERGNHLINRYSFTYLTSGRDLLRLQFKQASSKETVVLANPDFGERSEVRATKRDIKAVPDAGQDTNQTGDPNFTLAEAFFPSLPGTAGEAAVLSTLLPAARMLTKAQASETALKQVSRPRLLHIATHGFFLKDAGAGEPSGRDLQKAMGESRMENPYLRSGLAMAGANLRKSGDDDGILTALEAAGLDLWGTKLVVLSACNTGVGDVRNGDGVYGLRRALVLAGSESQVMSLWRVSDQGTKELMVEYYKRLLRGEGRGEALRQVQLQMLKRPQRRHPYYWASFIQSGEWANLDGKR